MKILLIPSSLNRLTTSFFQDYLWSEGSEDDGAEDGVSEDTLKNVSLSMDLAGIKLIEDLHEDKSIEHDGIVLRGRGVKRGIPATVDVKQRLTCKEDQRSLNMKSVYFSKMLILKKNK